MQLPTPQKISVEITSRCNLLCATCLRDIDNQAADMPLALFDSIVTQAAAVGVKMMALTGGEPTLHPDFEAMALRVIDAGLKLRIITNAFRPQPLLTLIMNETARQGIDHVAVSIDGAEETANDLIRGKGSFRRALSACGALRMRGVPFRIQYIIHSGNVGQIESMALLAAKLGASRLDFGFYLPTLRHYDAGLRMSPELMESAQADIQRLGGIFRMPITLSVGIHPTNLLARCGVMAGETWHVNYLGHLSLCCQLSNLYQEKRRSRWDSDIVADLGSETMREGWAAFERRMEQLLQAREADAARGALTAEDAWPCLYCMKHFEKRAASSAPEIEERHG